MRVYHSNSADVLSLKLAQQLTERTDNPLVPLSLVISNHSSRQWLSAALADHLGAIANQRWYFFSHLLTTLQKILSCPNSLDFSLPGIAWRIDSILDRNIDQLKPYWQRDNQPSLYRWRLAATLASCFVRYQRYRSDWLKSWQHNKTLDLGENEKWQKQLWQQLCLNTGSIPLYESRDRIIRALEDSSHHAKITATLGTSLHVYTEVELFFTFLPVLQALDKNVDVCFYCLNPCREYWMDIPQWRREYQGTLNITDEMYFEPPNQLLMQLGGSMAARLQQLQDCDMEEHDCYIEPEGSHSLGRLRQSILHNRVLASTPDATTEQITTESPLAELWAAREVIEDFLSDDSHAPHHCLIAVSDWETFAPLLPAALAGLPHTSTLCRNDQAIACVQTLLDLLAMPSHPLDGWVAWFTQPLVLSQLELHQSTVNILFDTLKRYGVRFGLGAESDDNQAFMGVSLRSGIRLLVTGLLSGESPLPGDSHSNQPLSWLQSLVIVQKAVESLTRTQKQMTGDPHPVEWWEDNLLKVTRRHLGTDASLPAQRWIRHWAEGALAVATTQYIDFAVVRASLGNDPHTQRIDSESGGIKILPLDISAGIPARLRIIVGCDNLKVGQGNWDFDLMAHYPRWYDDDAGGALHSALLNSIISTDHHIVMTSSSEQTHALLQPLLEHFERRFPGTSMGLFHTDLTLNRRATELANKQSKNLIAVNDLIAFWSNPSRFFFHRLGVYAPHRDPDGQELQWEIALHRRKQAMFEYVIKILVEKGEFDNELQTAFQIPQPEQLADIAEAARWLYDNRSQLAFQPLKKIWIDDVCLYDHGGLHSPKGSIFTCRSSRKLQNLSCYHQIEIAVRRCFLAVATENIPLEVVIWWQDRTPSSHLLACIPPDRATHYLQQMITHYRLQTEEPLPFLPRAAVADQNDEKSTRKAVFGNTVERGDLDDPYIAMWAETMSPDQLLALARQSITLFSRTFPRLVETADCTP